MQLLKIILWPRDNRWPARTVCFKAGAVNVVLGSSRTGKSTLWPIVDFCLGSSELRVPMGEARSKVDWYGALFTVQGRERMIARANPDHHKTVKFFAMLVEGLDLELPHVPHGNISREGLKAVLGQSLPALPNTQLGQVSYRDISIINSCAQYAIANPAAFLSPDAEEASNRKLRFALPILLGEPELVEVKSVRAERSMVERMGLRLRGSIEILESRLKSLYGNAQNLGLVPRNDLAPELISIRKIIFELGHLCRAHNERLGKFERISADHSESSKSSSDYHQPRIGEVHLRKEITGAGSLATSGSDGFESTENTIQAALPEKYDRQNLIDAQIFTLGRIRECLTMEYLIDELQELRDEWRSLSATIRELEHRGAKYYEALSAKASRYAKIMHLDYSNLRVVLEEKTLRTKFIFPDGKMAGLPSIGGIRNFAGYNISLLLALHESLALQGGRGTNRFLFLDEMSQAFPAKTESEQGEGAIAPIDVAFDALNEACLRSNGDLQIIALESFTVRESVPVVGGIVNVVEEWRDYKNALIPDYWEIR